jgi:hypothetical protein
MVSDRTGSTTNMSQQRTKPDQQQISRNNKQNRINNKYVATMNKTGSTTYISQQRTKPDQQQICRNTEQNRINNRHVATTKKTDQQ